MAPGTYGKTWWRNGYACGCMIASIEDVIEPRLRAAGYLGSSEKANVFQYAYNSSVSASAGTHGGGGALDHQKGSDGETRIWRECGVADWQRGSPEDTAFDDHNHGIWQGCPHLSGDAEGQISQYKQGCNGLAGWGADQSPDVPPITWQDAYDKYANTAPEGILGMTEQIWFHRSDDITPKGDGVWHDVPIENGSDPAYSVVNGDTKQIICSASVLVDGLNAGEMFDVCWREMRAKDGQPNDYTATRGPASPGANLGNVRAFYAGKLNKDGDGWKSRLRLSYRTDSKTAKVVSVLIEGWRS
jgi:hypothetical protein